VTAGAKELNEGDELRNWCDAVDVTGEGGDEGSTTGADARGSASLLRVSQPTLRCILNWLLMLLMPML
jgi:hypothetical protein